MMQAGKLRHRVDIESFSETRGTQGGITPGWKKDDEVWASVEPLSGRELTSAQMVNSDVTHRVLMRYLNGLTTKGHRIKHKTRILNIGSIINREERDIELELLCVEDVG